MSQARPTHTLSVRTTDLERLRAFKGAMSELWAHVDVRNEDTPFQNGGVHGKVVSTIWTFGAAAGRVIAVVRVATGSAITSFGGTASGSDGELTIELFSGGTHLQRRFEQLVGQYLRGTQTFTAVSEPFRHTGNPLLTPPHRR